jgi:hypothetical protein
VYEDLLRLLQAAGIRAPVANQAQPQAAAPSAHAPGAAGAFMSHDGLQGSELPEPDDTPGEEFHGAELHDVKTAGHPHDRMEERTPFPRAHVDQLQKTVDLMGLSPGAYHLPLRDAHGQLKGFAQFKGVKGRKTPVLATVLGPEMRPGGRDIEHLLKASSLSLATVVPGPQGSLTPRGPAYAPNTLSTEEAVRQAFGSAAAMPTNTMEISPTPGPGL